MPHVHAGRRGLARGERCRRVGGGGLWSVHGREATALLSPEVAPVYELVPVRGGFIALGGTAHLGLEEGALWRVERSEASGWRASVLAVPPGFPEAWALQPDGALLVATRAGVMTVAPDGALGEAGCLPPQEGPEPAPRWKD